MAVLIRQAKLEEIVVVAKLQKEFIDEHSKLYDSAFYEMSASASNEWSRWAAQKLSGGELGLFVAQKDADLGTYLVGYVTGWVETRPSIYVLDKIGYLSNIYVVPEHRGKGIGAGLNSALLDWFKKQGLKYVELYVDSRAKGSVDSWFKLGYTEVGKRMRISL